MFFDEQLHQGWQILPGHVRHFVEMCHADDGGDIGSLGSVFADVDALIDGHDVAALELEATERQALFGHGGRNTGASIVFENAGVGLGFEGLRFRTSLVSTTLAATTLSALLTASVATTLPSTLPTLLRWVGFGLWLGDFLSPCGRFQIVF